MAGRKGRSLLLVLAVALATALTVAVAAAMGSIERSVTQVVGRMTGLADLRIVHAFGGRLDTSLLYRARAWPEVDRASARYSTGISLRLERTDKRATLLAIGIQPDTDPLLHPVNIVDGRHIETDGQIVLEKIIADRLGARVGDKLAVIMFGDPVTLRLVGIVERPLLDVLQRRIAYVTLGQAQTLGGYAGAVEEIDLALRPGADAAEFQKAHAKDLPAQARFQTAAASSGNVNRGIATARLILLVITVLVFLSAGFIILTSLTTSVVERQRELGILRCIGAGRMQIALAQLIHGGMLAGAGALLGVPIGLAIAYGLYRYFDRILVGGFDPTLRGIVQAVAAAVFCGLVGSAYPAWLAARVRPMQALAIRAKTPRVASVLVCLAAGLVLASLPVVLLYLPIDIQQAFWTYLYVALPLLFLGYFLLSVPIIIVLTWLLAPVLAAALRLPRELLSRSVLATPFRHGFTGGALMVGLAMLVAIWTGGRSVMSGWFDRIQMPDGFVHSYYALSQAQWDALRSVPEIDAACPTTMFPVRTESARFGLRTLTPPSTLYVSFDPDTFFEMADLQWIQGDPAEALRRLKQGRSLLVSREYLEAHGLGVGGVLTLSTIQGPVDFEIVGVVASSGLDVAVQFFGINRAYADAAVSAVFGSRGDAITYFDIDAINLVLLSFKPEATDKQVLDSIRARVPGVVTGSSRTIRRVVHHSADRMMTVASSVAVGSLLIACFGVGNLLIANIAARRFEYGVLRAIGAHRFTLARLITAETLIVALTACVAGTGLGLQMAWVLQTFHRRLLGIVYTPRLPLDVVAMGVGVVVGLALIAALPAAIRLARTPPRELLATD